MLRLEPVYQSDLFKIEADLTHGVVRTEWLQSSIGDQELMNGGVKLNEFISKSNLTKVLANSQQLGSISSKAKDWLSTSYYEELSKLGIVKFARVLPANLFSKVALESVITRAEALGCIDFQVKSFGEEKAAVEWLLTGAQFS